MKAFITLIIFTSTAAIMAMEIPDLELESEAQNELNATLEYEDDDKDFGVVPAGVLFADAAGFNYKKDDPLGPSNWWKFNINCNGLTQSPINIKHEEAVIVKTPALALNYYTRDVKSIKYTNTGYTLVLEFTFAGTLENSFAFGGQTWIFHSAHLHWGSGCNGGSEHTLNFHRPAAEIHLVHYNKKYKSLENSLDKPDGLAVIGVFMELSDPTDGPTEHGEGDNKFIYQIPKLTEKGSTITVTDQVFNIQDFIHNEVRFYYSYKGSLTTPSCNPVVQWLVSRDFITISYTELAALNTLLGDDGPILINYRPVQRLNGRKVNFNA